MAGIRLEWAQFGDFDSFDVIRSDTSMADVADADLPSPIATNLKTMYYVDTAVILERTYYYKVGAWRDAVEVVSSEIKCVALDYHTFVEVESTGLNYYGQKLATFSVLDAKLLNDSIGYYYKLSSTSTYLSSTSTQQIVGDFEYSITLTLDNTEQYLCLLDTRNSSFRNGILFSMTSSGFYIESANSSSVSYLSITSSVTQSSLIGTTVKFKLKRVGITLTAFINDVEIGSVASSYTPNLFVGNVIIGKTFNSDSRFLINGKIREFYFRKID